ncbi:MSF1-domain-containing protein [Ramicandelaber brevisporus]|nr:MSF1-domain-containing protein [Ramicandelaber brevisporus]
MRFFEATHEYPHSWATVTLAHWCKYPNDRTPHVLNVDVINREIDPETGILRTERLIMCKQAAPWIVCKILGGEDKSYVLEYSEVDPKNRTLVARTTNLTFSDLMNVGETIEYKDISFASQQQQQQQKQNLAKTAKTVRQQQMALAATAPRTLFTQNAQITAFGAISRFSNLIEDFCVTRFRDNAAIGKLGLEQVIERITAARQTANL